MQLSSDSNMHIYFLRFSIIRDTAYLGNFAISCPKVFDALKCKSQCSQQFSRLVSKVSNCNQDCQWSLTTCSCLNKSSVWSVTPCRASSFLKMSLLFDFFIQIIQHLEWEVGINSILLQKLMFHFHGMQMFMWCMMNHNIKQEAVREIMSSLIVSIYVVLRQSQYTLLGCC